MKEYQRAESLDDVMVAVSELSSAGPKAAATDKTQVATKDEQTVVKKAVYLGRQKAGCSAACSVVCSAA
jgi:hypothetical protein